MRHTCFLSVVISVLIVAVTVAVIPARAAELQWIKPQDLKKLIESHDPKILVVDVQPKGAYDLGHIKGSINFPWALDIKSPENLPRDKTLILYCDCAHGEDSPSLVDQLTIRFDQCASEDDSLAVAEQLMSKFGYTNIKVLEGGWSKWQQLGYPVD